MRIEDSVAIKGYVRMKFEAHRIVDITGGSLLVAPADDKEVLSGLSWDSRTVEPGWMYAAFAGARVDGHDFALSAFEAGARMALVSRALDNQATSWAREHGCAVVLVEDVAAAIVKLASAWRDVIPATVVGVTGSVGKTTTKSLIRQVLSSRFKTHATKGNFNNELGAPLTVLSAAEDCEMLVVEMGMDDFGQIEFICDFARPDLGIITNVGVSHLEYLKTRENIARAKAELIEALPEGSTAFLHEQGEFTPFIIDHAKTGERGVNVVLYAGKEREAGVFATDVRLDGEGRPRFVLHADGQEAECELSLRGLHNVDNACGAAAVGLACGLDLATVAEALGQAQPEAGRQELKRARCGAVVFNDAYNASPDSMKASLAMLSAYETKGRRVAVLGDMGELGDNALAGHEEVGRAAAAAGLGLLVCVGDLARGIESAAIEAGMDKARVVRVSDAAAAAEELNKMISAEDVVLVKASHFMGLDRVVEGIVD